MRPRGRPDVQVLVRARPVRQSSLALPGARLCFTMTCTTPWFRDDERPFLQRTDTMLLDVIRPKDVPRGQVMYPKDYDKSLMTEEGWDISRCQPTYDHLKYLEKPDMSVGCTDPVHPGGKARSYYAPMDRRPRDLSLTTVGSPKGAAPSRGGAIIHSEHFVGRRCRTQLEFRFMKYQPELMTFGAAFNKYQPELMTFMKLSHLQMVRLLLQT
eukprot:Skav200444  [mRNA]  locus=scaffold1922:49570:57119:- [translate_table: standard]